MKPNQNQKEVIKAVACCILHWENTNDINSPIHWSMIDDFVRDNPDIDYDLETTLSESGIREAISDKLSELLTLIRQIK